MASCDYLYSNCFAKLEDFIPKENSVYIYSYSLEERSHCVDYLRERYGSSITFVGIKEKEEEKDIIVDIQSKKEVHLRSSKMMSDFFKDYDTSFIYIDVTGLDNRICASMLKNAFIALGKTSLANIRTIYVEPDTYDIKEFCTEGMFHDLSEKIDGIDPLPGFASIIPDENEDICFIPLLGFEGGRFTHLLEEFQPPEDNIIPIIGVPGYRLEYPFYTYWGNRQPLKQTEAWRNVKYAAANSVVDVYILFSKIHRKYPNCRIKIAPIGTKPHAIGAMLYALKNPKETELIYDNPKRKKRRSSGVGKIIENNVSKLYQEYNV